MFPIRRLIQLKSHPFRLLLYLEWILLGLSILIEFPLGRGVLIPPELRSELPLIKALSITAFGIMGLRLPTGKLIYKILYSAVEFGLVLLVTIAGGWIIRFPFLYLIVVIRSCLIFKPTGRLIVTGLVFISFLFSLMLRVQSFQFPIPIVSNILVPPTKLLLPNKPIQPEQLRFIIWNLTLNATLLFGLVLVFVLLLINALLGERQSREKLADANEQLRQYALRIEDQATLQERNRIAREIHDSLGHSLTALNLQLETALKLWSADPIRATEFLSQAKQLGSKALQEVRQSVSTLRFDPLQGQSLEIAVNLLVEEFSRSTTSLPICQIQLTRLVSAEVKTTVYRIVQEALTNICKHAAATEVKIDVQTTSAELWLSIQDNGIGFKAYENTTGFGLQSMRERTLALGGTFEIITAPAAGCKITASFPLSQSTIE